MSHVPHERADEFPEPRAKIQSIKQTDAHFSKPVDDYHTVNREIHRIETGVRPTAENFEKPLHWKRVSLKGQILQTLNR